ncbi:MAG: hypothetical protein E6J24_16000 [Chloroflexi bacterium]|nr:MAG: hypothetical protein E6J24_16000 [Chloroflexota bacterium]
MQADEALGHLLPDRMIPARVADRRAVAHDDRARDAMALVGVAHRPPVPDHLRVLDLVGVDLGVDVGHERGIGE